MSDRNDAVALREARAYRDGLKHGFALGIGNDYDEYDRQKAVRSDEIIGASKVLKALPMGEGTP